MFHSSTKPGGLPDVLVLPDPIPVEPAVDEENEHHESRTSEAVHRPQEETSPPVKAVNMPM